MTHLQFKTKLCKEFFQNYEIQSDPKFISVVHRPSIHILSHFEKNAHVLFVRCTYIVHTYYFQYEENYRYQKMNRCLVQQVFLCSIAKQYLILTNAECPHIQWVSRNGSFKEKPQS